jgi:hypothetical protein
MLQSIILITEEKSRALVVYKTDCQIGRPKFNVCPIFSYIVSNINKLHLPIICLKLIIMWPVPFSSNIETSTSSDVLHGLWNTNLFLTKDCQIFIKLNQQFSSPTSTVKRYGKIQSNTFMHIQIYMKHRPGTE